MMDSSVVGKENEEIQQEEPEVETESLDLGSPESVDVLLKHYNLLASSPGKRIRDGNGEVVLEALSMVNEEGVPTREFQYNEEITLYYQICAKEDVDSDFMLGVRVYDIRGHAVFSMNDLGTIHQLKLSKGTRTRFKITFHVPLHHSSYILKTGLFGFTDGKACVGGKYDYNRAIIWDRWDDVLHFKIRECSFMPLAGPVHFHTPITWI